MLDPLTRGLIAAAFAQLAARDDFDRTQRHSRRYSARYEIACLAVEDAVRAIIKAGPPPLVDQSIDT